MRNNPLLSSAWHVIRLLILGCLLANCSQGLIPNNRSPQPDNFNGRENFKSEQSLSENQYSRDRYTKDHYEILKLIDKGKEKNLLIAGSMLERALFGPNAQEKTYYSSPQYGGYLEILVIFQKKVSSPQKNLTAMKWQNLKGLFNKQFIDPCLFAVPTSCQRAERAFSQESSVVQVALEIARDEKDKERRLKILGMIFDNMGNRKSTSLNFLYIDTIIDIYDEPQRQISDQRLEQHILNVSHLTAQMDWSNPSPEKAARFLDLQPWKYDGKKGEGFALVQKTLVPFLPIYALAKNQIVDELQKKVEERLEKVKEGAEDLSKFPAYSSVKIDSILSKNPMAAFLVLELYSNNIDINTARAFQNNFPKEMKASAVSEVFEMVKLLTRWDIAQTGILSTRRLNDRFSKQQVKTKVFVQETLNWSRSLITYWTQFHNVRMPNLKVLVESGITSSDRYTLGSALDFFAAINRNILKTVVYPNMMAFTYEMAKTEYNATFRILWFTFTLDATNVLDYMLTGQYEYPWFNFVNLAESSGQDVGERSALYRSEMYDSLYYFFTTRTAEIYGITADEFLETIARTIFKRRRGRYQDTLDIQKGVYFDENGPAQKYLNWCHKLGTKLPAEELIVFYDIYEELTPGHTILRNYGNFSGGNAINKDFTSYFDDGVVPTYFGDNYINKSFKYDNLMTVNDRYRMIFEPVFHTLSRYGEIVADIIGQHPELNLSPLKKYNKKMDEFRLLKMSYLGMQIQLSERFRKCHLKAYAEAKRRMQEMVFAQRKYFNDVVHPLMRAVKNGNRSVTQANQILKNFHSRSSETDDQITLSNDGTPYYNPDENTYFLRTRQFLTQDSEMDASSFGGSPSIQFPAIVGPHLSVPIPEDFLTDPENPYNALAEEPDKRSFIFMEDPEQFSTSVVRSLVDPGQVIFTFTGWDQWDMDDVSEYASSFKWQLQYEALMYQIPEQDYIKVTEPGCLVGDWSLLDQDNCITTYTPSVQPLKDTIAKIYEVYILKGQDLDLMDMITMPSWANLAAMDTVLKHDRSFIYDQTKKLGNSVPATSFAGVFDRAYDLLKSDYLGFLYVTPWDKHMNSKTTDPMVLGNTCDIAREGCFWANEKERAQEFFISRGLKAKNIFNFDISIVEKDYSYNRTLVVDKFHRLQDLEDKGQTYLGDMIDSHPALGGEVRFSRFYDGHELYPLSQSLIQGDSAFNEYFYKTTQGFYFKDHLWKDYLID